MFALVTSQRFGRKEKSKMFSQMQDARQDSYGKEIFLRIFSCIIQQSFLVMKFSISTLVDGNRSMYHNGSESFCVYYFILIIKSKNPR